MNNWTIRCPACENITTVQLGTKRFLNPLQMVVCPACHGTFLVTHDLVVTKPSGPNVMKKRSKTQERVSAKRDGARVQPGSGAMDHAKGDVRLRGIYRKECKVTTRSSFSVTRHTLDKITKEATGGEAPVLEVEFQEVFPRDRLYVVPEWVWDHYVELRRARATK